MAASDELLKVDLVNVDVWRALLALADDATALVALAEKADELLALLEDGTDTEP